MASAEPEFIKHEGFVSIALPLTTPTGKVRVKRRQGLQQAVPVATRQEILQDSDYLEWQIGYWTAQKENYSALGSVQIKRGKEVFYAHELMWLLDYSRSVGWLSEGNKMWRNLRALLKNGPQHMLESAEQIKQTKPEKEVQPPVADLAQFGFQRTLMHVPFYAKRESLYGVEITLSAKQRAVGLQAMVYAILPLAKCRDEKGMPLIGRAAQAKERAHYRLNETNVGLLIDLVAAFALASRRHRDDMKTLLQKMNLL